jgi:hypothetical protein
MEMDQEANPEVWKLVERIAAYASKADPAHPAMTVVAEINAAKLAMIERYCPSIRILGINAYGGAPGVAGRYRALGGRLPYVLTEFGPPGPWEVAKTSWGAPIEVSSTEKGAHYRAAYEGSVARQPMSLGSYAFAWGHKQEATATWFSLLLPDGTRLAAVDELQQAWTGKRVARPVPAIERLALAGADRVHAGDTVHLTLEMRDAHLPDLDVQWVLQSDPPWKPSGGAHEDAPPLFPRSILRSDARGVDVRMPEGVGGYRVFAYVRDRQGGGAVANVPVFVEGRP